MFSAASKTKQVAPSAAATDPYIGNVTLLVHGDGTNGQTNNLPVDSGPLSLSPVAFTGNPTMGSFGPFWPNWSTWFPTGQYCTGGMSAGTDFGTGDFTIEGWFNFTSSSLTVTSDLFRIGDNGPAIRVVPTGFQFERVGTGGGIVITHAVTRTQGIWYHIAVTKLSGTTTMWINGVNVAQVSDSYNYNTFSSFNIAGTLHSGVYISNCRLSDVALYTSSFTPIKTPLELEASTLLLVAHRGSHIVQGSRTLNGRFSTISTTPICTTYSPFSTVKYDPSIHGASVHLDGTGDLVRVPASSAHNLGSGDFTYETWYYGYGTIAGGLIGQRATVAAYAPLDLLIASSNRVSLTMSSDGASWAVNQTSITQPMIITRYSWNHFVVTRSGTAIKVFVNGVLLISTTYSGSIMAGVSEIVLGARSVDLNSVISGYLSDCRLVPGTNLYPTSVTTLYTQVFTPPTEPLTSVSGTSFLCNFKNAGVYDERLVRNIELVGSCYVNTSSSKFGGSSLFMDNSSVLSYAKILTSPSHAIPTSQNFTIECWVNPSDINNRVIFYQGGVGIRLTTTAVQVYTGTFTVRVTATYTVPTSSWTHIAVCRLNGVITIYINGNATGTPVSYTTSLTSTAGMWIGSHSTPDITTSFNGMIEELRYTNGIARYSTNFDLPAAAYPDI